jgi:hypothetical protein
MVAVLVGAGLTNVFHRPATKDTTNLFEEGLIKRTNDDRASIPQLIVVLMGRNNKLLTFTSQVTSRVLRKSGPVSWLCSSVPVDGDILRFC